MTTYIKKMLMPFPLVRQEMNCKETIFIQEVIPPPVK